jgi:hypothetical protein
MSKIQHIWLFILLLFASSITAQDEPPYEIVLEGEFGTGWMLSWSQDSQRLVFISEDAGYCEYECEGNLYLNDDMWYEFDVVSGMLSRASTWFLQPALTPELEHMLNPYSFRYESPDGEWLLYLRFLETTTDFFLYHYPTERILPLDVPFCYGLCPGNLSNTVFWTENNELIISFVYGTPYVAEPRVLRVHLQDPINTQIVDVSNPIPIGEHLFAPFDVAYNGVLDVQDDEVLMFADHVVTMDSPSYEYPNQVHLVVWSPITQANEMIANQTEIAEVVAASFAPNDPTKIIILTYRQLLLFDRNTRSITELWNDVIALNIAERPVFSPNGEWLAIPRRHNNGSIGFVNIPNLLGEN